MGALGKQSGTKKTVRVLSVDPGYDRLGVAVIERNVGGKERLLYSACIETPKTDEFSARLKALGEEFERIIETYSPGIFASETLFFTKNQKTALLVAGARGVLTYLAEKHGLSVFEYTPLQIKIAVTGYGKSDKQQVTAMVERLIAVEKPIRHDDEYDAIAVGLTCLASERF